MKSQDKMLHPAGLRHPWWGHNLRALLPAGVGPPRV